MTRNFQFTGAADTAYHNLYSKLLSLSGAVPTNGILPDRVCEVTVQLDGPITSASNAGQTLTIGDNNQAGGLGIEAGGSNTWRSERNTICLRDFSYKQSAASLVVNISISSK